MTAINDLLAFQRQTEALSSVAERLGWDQETVMPRGAAEQLDLIGKVGLQNYLQSQMGEPS